MREYHITLTGTQPLLMHNRDLSWEETVKRWSKDPAHKADSVPGDDRSPAWSWIGKLHHDGMVICLPVDMLASCMMAAGAMVPSPRGRGRASCKSLSQSGCILENFFWPLTIAQGTKEQVTLPMPAIFALKELPDFAAHEAAVTAMGFRLHVKPARVGTSSHIRVRPLFTNWRVEGNVRVIDDQLTQDLLATILDYAGKYKGLGDWRPGCKTPGSWGMFEATVEAV